MSTDPSAAIGRIDAAVEESSRPPGVPPRELADLATVIERIESLIVEGAAQGPDHTAAVERISDIAFTLQEHEVETSLCDTLDAAVREINDVGALKDGSAERRQQAAELLRQLSRRVHEMIAQSQTNRSPGPAVGAGAAQTSNKAGRAILDEGDGDDDAIGGGSFKTDVPEDDEFALVVAALTAALPSLAEFGAPVPVPPAALAQDAVPLPDGALLPELSVETVDEGKAAESETVLPQAESSDDMAVVIGSSRAVLVDEPVLPQTPSSESLALGEDFVRDLMPNGNLAAERSAEVGSSSDAPAEDSEPDALLALLAPKARADSPHTASPKPSDDLAGREAELPADTEEQRLAAVVGPVPADAAGASREDGLSGALLPLVAPEDDPGDLFESTMLEPSIVPKSEHPGAQAAERVPEAERAVEAALSVSAPLDPEPQAPTPMPPPQSRAAAAAPAQPQPVPRPASNDPLAPIRALTEEEMIALFS
jgi:hypothetical protein